MPLQDSLIDDESVRILYRFVFRRERLIGQGCKDQQILGCTCSSQWASFPLQVR